MTRMGTLASRESSTGISLAGTRLRGSSTKLVSHAKEMKNGSLILSLNFCKRTGVISAGTTLCLLLAFEAIRGFINCSNTDIAKN